MQLGYLVFEVKDVARWTQFFTDVLGMEDVGDGRFRMDGHAWRFQIQPGERNDLACVGWEMASLDDCPGEDADPAERGVQSLRRAVDPGGVPVESYTGPELSSTPFSSALVPGGFVADELGLGHLVVTSKDKAESRAFYEGVGAKLSDHIRCEIHGYPVDVSFFHVNPRHHSVAFGGPQRSRLHHFMVEAHEIDAVGAALDRTLKAGLQVMQTLGRHPNDRMLSFYAKTPGGFQFEFGWGGRLVDDATWEPTTYDRISEWGHLDPQLAFAPPKRSK
ncbi:MAG: hypothetical protein GY913_34790 [Proteobacteria bacterium]|nr:hypothetical protein [Pseudomonadota bacterium]